MSIVDYLGLLDLFHFIRSKRLLFGDTLFGLYTDDKYYWVCIDEIMIKIDRDTGMTYRANGDTWFLFNKSSICQEHAKKSPKGSAQ